jgi:hypothetical protein
MTSRISAVREKRRCKPGCKKSLYGALRTVVGAIFRTLQCKALLLCVSVVSYQLDVGKL